MPTPEFNFYANSFCVSCNTDAEPDKTIKSDFLLEGDLGMITKAIIIQMGRHPEVATIISNAAYRYLTGQGEMYE